MRCRVVIEEVARHVYNHEGYHFSYTTNGQTPQTGPNLTMKGERRSDMDNAEKA